MKKEPIKYNELINALKAIIRRLQEFEKEISAKYEEK